MQSCRREWDSGSHMESFLLALFPITGKLNRLLKNHTLCYLLPQAVNSQWICPMCFSFSYVWWHSSWVRRDGRTSFSLESFSEHGYLMGLIVLKSHRAFYPSHPLRHFSSRVLKKKQSPNFHKCLQRKMMTLSTASNWPFIPGPKISLQIKFSDSI